ncbi:ABC transporter permease [Clostridium tagluense]|uniref:ABC transporter permease n=1 Tax=Clostridium tagluense TaxID=360422 RepID=UPI001C6E1CA8|nr:ABC-2 family transporter protein [Clostridium tagluense]MBW9156849.1 ABC-2 family transporter protein [Clostridium tagluense]WLC66328.1 ABC-2 family transporter protein [Clostridium tagluense]
MKLYFKFLSLHIRSAMEYKVSFILTTIGQFFISFTSFLGLYYLFARFDSVQGFTFEEVLISYSVVLMAYSIAECFSYGFKTFSNTIASGGFDLIMIRPCNEIFLVFVSTIEFTSLGRFVQALLVMIYSISTGVVEWNLHKVIVYIGMIIGGVFLFMGLYIIYAALCFFTVEGLEFINIFTDGGREFGKYPMNIYGSTILKFFTYIVPLACVQYYPLLYLLGKENNIGLALTPLYTIVFLILSYGLWIIGVRNYKSTGS